MKKLDFIVCLLVIILSITAFSEDFSAIRNPKPNMKEKKYTLLKKVKIRNSDLGNGEYLFLPFSLTIDQVGNVYVYDILQAKIFKFDPNLEIVKKSFGGQGAGPGEFGGTGKGYPVFIQVGRDGKLYANDIRMRKVIVFDQNGKYLGEFKNKVINMKIPLVDTSGTFHIVNVKDKIINVYDENKLPLFTLANQKGSFDYLYSKPGPYYLKMAYQRLTNELLAALTINSTLLLYFPSSSTMVVIKNKKIIKQMKLWPQEAMTVYKIKLDRVRKMGENKYISLFSKLFVDEDNDEVFFLQFGWNQKKGTNTLYQFKFNGELQKVNYVKVEESAPFIRFEAKKRNMFYAIEKDTLTLYKEAKK